MYAGQALGAESTLPYLSPELNGEKLLVGANFASAGIGILNDTGVQFVSFTYLINLPNCLDLLYVIPAISYLLT